MLLSSGGLIPRRSTEVGSPQRNSAARTSSSETRNKPIVDRTDDEFDAVFYATNAWAGFVALRESADGGRVIMISAGLTRMPRAGARGWQPRSHREQRKAAHGAAAKQHTSRGEPITEQIHPFQRQSDAMDKRSDQASENLTDNTVTTNTRRLIPGRGETDERKRPPGAVFTLVPAGIIRPTRPITEMQGRSLTPAMRSRTSVLSPGTSTSSIWTLTTSRTCWMASRTSCEACRTSLMRFRTSLTRFGTSFSTEIVA